MMPTEQAAMMHYTATTATEQAELTLEDIKRARGMMQRRMSEEMQRLWSEEMMKIYHHQGVMQGLVKDAAVRQQAADIAKQADKDILTSVLRNDPEVNELVEQWPGESWEGELVAGVLLGGGSVDDALAELKLATEARCWPVY